MLPVLTCAQCRLVDRLAVERLGLPSIVLMENAARGAAEVVHREAPGQGVLIVCGGGNNGGDGYAVARHLDRLGHAVTLHPVTPLDKLAGDALVNALACRALGLSFVESFESCAAPVVVDALLGTGFTGAQVREPAAGAVRWINAAHRFVVALDAPSGLDCDTGRPAEPTVRADLTVTFLARKPGFASPAARECLGRVVVADIGLPEGWVRGVVDL